MIGTLTLLTALLISIQLHHISKRSTEWRKAEITRQLYSHYDEVEALSKKLEREIERHSDHYEEEQRLEKILEKVNRCMKRAEVLMEEPHEIWRFQFWMNIAFVPRKDIIKLNLALEKMEEARRIAKELEREVSSDTNSVQGPAPHEVAFHREVIEELLELKKEMIDMREDNMKLLGEMQKTLEAVYMRV